MKIAVTQDALLGSLVEGIRDERDHGGALMRLMSRLVNEAGRQGWFETHWRTEARLSLAQLACGDLPADWRSAGPALDVIAEAARWALKTDLDSEARAALVAITRLVDIARSLRTSTEAETRPASEPAPRRKARRPAQARRARMGASRARPAARAKVQARPVSKAAIARTNGAATRKKSGVVPMSKSLATKTAKPAAKAVKTTKTTKTVKTSKPRTSAKAAAARKANGVAPMSRSLAAKPAKRTTRTARPSRPPRPRRPPRL
jgi:hypothetical protein